MLQTQWVNVTIWAFWLSCLTKAEGITGLPTCAQICGTTVSCGCAQTDVECLCRACPSTTSMLSCLATSCTLAEQQETIAFASQFCASFGVTVHMTLPTATSSTIYRANATTVALPSSSNTDVQKGNMTRPTKFNGTTSSLPAYTGPAAMGMAVTVKANLAMVGISVLSVYYVVLGLGHL